ncbi:DciA family protein [uncultured Thiodictyon sp.]|jgi:predicted nucleic acid-binding Zn ribbon protein|uniref:DciA family protein n=1 Tax=uncultured Thiodictyon sp. TaxID=1846217 RepID=UPI0025F04BC2|nr:DciA family protein [uncultured Thiodictyon sp.]
MAKKRPGRTSAAHVRDLLTTSPAVARCLALQRREDCLLAQVRELLAPAARPHCIQVSTTDGTLTVTVDAAAWATRLRYQAPDLARGLEGAGITSVKVRARPRERVARRQTAQHLARLTPAVVEHLMAAAAHMTDAGLADVFRRLAARHQEARPGAPLD